MTKCTRYALIAFMLPVLVAGAAYAILVYRANLPYTITLFDED